MVTNVTSFGRSGLYDWLIQRFTAIVLLSYVLCIAGVLLTGGASSYEEWADHFSGTPMKVFSVMALVSIIVHAWIGMWGVSTDYLTVRLIGQKANALRLAFQGGYTVVLFAYLVWGIQILWGN